MIGWTGPAPWEFEPTVKQEDATEAEHAQQIHNWMQDDMGLDLTDCLRVNRRTL